MTQPPPTARRGPTTSPGREALIVAGAALFAEHGLNGVSLREITRAAGQRNATALQYHFQNRDGLVRAIVECGADRVGPRRLALLDAPGRTPATARELASLYVTPLLGELDGGSVGRSFLRVVGHLMMQTDQELTEQDALWGLMHDAGGSMDRWVELTELTLPAVSLGRPFHRRFTAIRVAHLELARRAQFSPEGSSPRFASHLVDLVELILASPPSPETLALTTR